MTFRGLNPQLVPYAELLLQIAVYNGLSPRVTSVLRSTALQTRLYRNYLAGNSAYPVAPPGASRHELGLAFDMVVTPMDYLEPLGQLWESWGGRWGGRFRDPIHFDV